MGRGYPLPGGGYPLPRGGTPPTCTWEGGPPSRPGKGYCRPATWEGGTPPAWIWEGVPPCLDLGRGYPPCQPGMVVPPPPVEVWTDTQSETITFPHPSDAGGKNLLRRGLDGYCKKNGMNQEFSRLMCGTLCVDL